jgi:isoamylase
MPSFSTTAFYVAQEDRPSPVLSRPWPLGVTLTPDGADVAVYSETAERIDICVVDDAGQETRFELQDKTGHVFHGIVPELTAGSRYGLRVTGPWDPANGLRHNVNKLLLDPYAKAITGDYHWGQTVFGHDLFHPKTMDPSDSLGSVPLCVVIDHDTFDWGKDRPPLTPLEETVVYETHVKGFTARHPGVPQELRGTYAGLAHPAAIRHLTDLGVTAVELMPVHQFVQDSHLLEKGLRNYWGYNSIGFLAPHGAYSHTGDDGGQVDEFKTMVKALHAAGLEVSLDVVFNHTAEGNDKGPTPSMKGIDNASYYRLVEGDRKHYFDTTGTGNSVNVSHPAALRLIMDSLRYWVTDLHVDGFRFDLATTLTRQGGNAALHSAFLTLIAQDPILAPVKMIAEPWDTAGYQLGGFPADWSEWNGKFRDDARGFWSGVDAQLGTMAERLLGSPDIYEDSRRPPTASVNFITAHDGFTLADLTSYDAKENDANGENNADGESHNRSANNGVEGPTDDPQVNERRARQRKNLLATVLLSAGVPMILGGDELGRTQGGNNNAYCQDNEISWYDWDQVDEPLLEFTKRLIALRRAEPALRPKWFRRSPDCDSPRTVELFRFDGKPFEESDWADSNARTITLVVGNDGEDSFGWLVNGAGSSVEFTVPPAPGAEWSLELSSGSCDPLQAPVTTAVLPETSFVLLRSAH